jgi:hypothetical protein
MKNLIQKIEINLFVFITFNLFMLLCFIVRQYNIVKRRTLKDNLFIIASYVFALAFIYQILFLIYFLFFHK